MMKFALLAALTATVSGTCSGGKAWIYRTLADDTKELKNLGQESVSRDMPGWSISGMDARLWGVPDILSNYADNARAHFPDQTEMILPGTQFKLKCPNDCSGKPCDFFFFVYHCPPCSHDTNGGLTAILPADGWEAGSCAPRFSYVADKYEMVGFRRQLAPGETYWTPEIEKDLMHVAIFSIVKQPDCPTFDYNGCIGCFPQCDWQDATCKSNWCPRRFIQGGTPPSCMNCVPNYFP
eukprot:TRINITY_DN900_c0_g1_i2.p1 TRINITY_DN900_c0_g1~~TRINITY_DN900_c0_g1_i2.p1  ORF type:complete len:260 (+),score=61.49 TRINITY_DN900_c0_g1_i2:71-781(+)